MSTKTEYHIDVVEPDGDKKRINFGASGTVLTSNGATSEPSFQAVTHGGVFLDSDFTLQANGATTNQAKVTVGSTGGNTRTFTTPDEDGTLALNRNSVGCYATRDSVTGNLVVPTNTWTTATLTTTAFGTHDTDNNWSGTVYSCPLVGRYTFHYQCRFNSAGISTGDEAQIRFLLASGNEFGTYTEGQIVGVSGSFCATAYNILIGTAGTTVEPQIRHFAVGNLTALADGATITGLWSFSVRYHGP